MFMQEEVRSVSSGLTDMMPSLLSVIAVDICLEILFFECWLFDYVVASKTLLLLLRAGAN